MSAMRGFFACNKLLQYSHSMIHLKNIYWLYSESQQKESDKSTRKKSNNCMQTRGASGHRGPATANVQSNEIPTCPKSFFAAA